MWTFPCSVSWAFRGDYDNDHEDGGGEKEEEGHEEQKEKKKEDEEDSHRSKDENIC